MDGVAGALDAARRFIAGREGAVSPDGSDLCLSGVQAIREADGALHLFPSRTEWGSKMVMGAEILFYDRVRSTNDRTRTLVADGARAGTVVLAEAQSAGRGRHGRVWHSPEGGGLYFTTLLLPRMRPELLGWITLSASLALVRAARQVGAVLTIKWPNDVACEGKKVAGVLAEAIYEGERLRAIVLGTGINVIWEPERLPPEIRDRATALSCCTTAIVERDTFLASFLWEFDGLYEELEAVETPPPPIASEVMAHLAHIGEPVRVRTGGGIIEGICTGLTEEGYLELAGGRRIASGELIIPMQEGRA